MPRSPAVAGNQFRLPLIEQTQREPRIPNFIAQIVGNPAVRVDVVEVLTQTFWQEPRGDREILVMRGGETLAIGAGIFERRRDPGDRVFLREMVPARQRWRRRHWPGFAAGDGCHSESVSRSNSC